MPWSTLQSPHSEKMKEPFFSYENTLPFLAFLMACGRYGHVITTSTDPRSWERKAMSPSSTVHWGQYDTKYLVCNIRIDGASGIRGGENFIRLVSWTSSYQPRDRNTRNRTRRYYNLLARILRATCPNNCSLVGRITYCNMLADLRLYKEILNSTDLRFRPKATLKVDWLH